MCTYIADMFVCVTSAYGIHKLDRPPSLHKMQRNKKKNTIQHTDISKIYTPTNLHLINITFISPTTFSLYNQQQQRQPQQRWPQPQMICSCMQNIETLNCKKEEKKEDINSVVGVFRESHEISHIHTVTKQFSELFQCNYMQMSTHTQN